MANTKSAKKELRKNIKRQAYNKKIRENLKNLIKKSRQAIEARDAKAKELVSEALKALDKATRKKIIKKNTCDRKKSRLQRKLNLNLNK